MTHTKELLDTVVKCGYCIGCGACASLEGSPIKIQLGQDGCMKAVVGLEQADQSAAVMEVCPFSDKSINEDIIGGELFGRDCRKHDKIGYHLNTYVGHVSDEGFRQRGSSGGLGSWILVQLFKRKMIDAVIHIHERKPTQSDGRLFAFGISKTEEEIRNGAKSRYYPVEMSEVLSLVKTNNLRFAIVGVPCFIKAIRLLSKKDPVYAQRIRYCIGLVCGHLKSTAFAEMFAWESGIKPNDLLAIDFRKKFPEKQANDYGVLLTDKNNGQVVKACKDFKGYDWGKGFFKYTACDYCDDVLAETADLVIGDAWLPDYVKEGMGTNIVITRRPELDAILKEGIQTQRLEMKNLSADDVAQSQDAGLRHRREGLAYRLFLKDQNKQWRPTKRIQASDSHITERQKKIFKLRIEVAEASLKFFTEAKAKGDYAYFQKNMAPLIKRYDAFYAQPLVKRIKEKMKRVLKKLGLKKE
jgi:coenzyme F420-reducing hydrogenase beta subunit